MKKNTLTQFDR